MRAVILAAGRGQRLKGYNPDNRPKCLLEVGGKSLLQRQLQVLSECGLKQADIVVGHAAEQIVGHVSSLEIRPRMSFFHNPRFELGSVLSLAAAHPALTSGEPVLVMDADVLFHPGILNTLVNSSRGNCFLLDRDFIPGEEPVKIAVKDHVMVEFRKQLPDGLRYDTIGESVGFFRFESSVAADACRRCETYELNGLADSPHEEVIRDLLMEHPERFAFEDITGLPWLELDFPEDIFRAEQEVLPAIRKDYPLF